MIKLFIAIRYLKAKHKISFISIISLLSTLGVAIGVAALVIILSVFNGFGNLVNESLINFDPHVQIMFNDSTESAQIENVNKLLDDREEIVSTEQFLQSKCLLKGKRGYDVVELKGIENNRERNWGVINKLIAGRSHFDENSPEKEIIISFPLALKLSVRLGDSLTAISFSELGESLTNFVLPRNEQFRIVGIYETNNKELDYRFAFTNIESAKDLLAAKQISGIEIRLTDPNFAAELKDELQQSFREANFKVYTWFDLHKDLFDVMLIERWAAYILLTLIITVAVFNILSSLTMTVLEKQKDIGILRSLGLTKNDIKNIFMFEGMIAGVLGTMLGLSLGLLVCYLQLEFNIYPLDPTKYIIDSLPVVVNLSDLIIIAFTAITLTFFAAYYPAKKSLPINLIEAIKWE
ncbi:MAG: ABC transporter permease [Melioribacteraceae bacterium]|nr:ABC transporter permease [Melioribacteraceae bacterium]